MLSEANFVNCSIRELGCLNDWTEALPVIVNPDNSDDRNLAFLLREGENNIFVEMPTNGQYYAPQLA